MLKAKVLDSSVLPADLVIPQTTDSKPVNKGIHSPQPPTREVQQYTPTIQPFVLKVIL